MSNPATVVDVVDRWRPLTPAEDSVAQVRLDDAWRKLKRDIPDLETRMASSDDLTADTIRVLADSVIRVLQANERGGLRKGSVGVDDGSASWELDSTIRAALYFTEDEYGDLSNTGRRKRARAYSVQPS